MRVTLLTAVLMGTRRIVATLRSIVARQPGKAPWLSIFANAVTGGHERAIRPNMKTLFGYFWRGCLVLLPTAATVYIAYLIFRTVDRLIPIGVPGLGFVLTVVVIT